MEITVTELCPGLQVYLQALDASARGDAYSCGLKRPGLAHPQAAGTAPAAIPHFKACGPQRGAPVKYL